MRRRINSFIGIAAGPESLAPADEVLEAPIEAPTRTREEQWQDRMAEQRRAWREQDTGRYRDATKERLLDEGVRDDLWVVYTYARKRWVLCGTRAMKTHRRKPMTLNRLFAAVRQKFGIPREQPVKLISEVDDRLRLLRGDPFLPPQHMLGRNAIVS